jgi:hypothetical protein
MRRCSLAIRRASLRPPGSASSASLTCSMVAPDMMRAGVDACDVSRSLHTCGSRQGTMQCMSHMADMLHRCNRPDTPYPDAEQGVSLPCSTMQRHACMRPMQQCACSAECQQCQHHTCSSGARSWARRRSRCARCRPYLAAGSTPGAGATSARRAPPSSAHACPRAARSCGQLGTV